MSGVLSPLCGGVAQGCQTICSVRQKTEAATPNATSRCIVSSDASGWA